MTKRQETAAPGNSRRKTMAILAGGLVLGVGAAVTLAAWNDSEFATGEFSAGTFILQGSTDGEVFSDHPSAEGAATLEFTESVDNLSPGDVVYAPFALQLTGTSDAEIDALDPVATGAIEGSIEFAAVATTDFACDESAFAGGVALPTQIQTGDTVNLCLEVTAQENLAQGATGEVLWQWNAESTQ